MLQQLTGCYCLYTNKGVLVKKTSKVLMFLFICNFSIAASAAAKNFDRAVFVVFENTNYIAAINEPFFKKLAQSGANFTNMLALTHPSQGNYIGLTSGSLNGVNDNSAVDLNVRNIADLLEAKGLTWKVYAEDYPGNCFTGRTNNGYARKHNPFISYLSVQKDPNRCANIVSLNQFFTDSKNGTLPNYVFVVPNSKSSGHDTGVAYASKWYQKNFEPLVTDQKFMENTILITMFDESSGGKNQIYTTIVGPKVSQGSYNEKLSLYSLLKLVEDNFDLGHLGKEDSTATAVPQIWK